jgi:hypothetical protein
MRANEQNLNEIEQEMVSSLLNVDDMIYTNLCEPLTARYRTAMTPNILKIGGLEKNSMGSPYEEEAAIAMNIVD